MRQGRLVPEVAEPKSASHQRLGLVRDHKLIVTGNLGLEHDGARQRHGVESRRPFLDVTPGLFLLGTKRNKLGASLSFRMRARKGWRGRALVAALSARGRCRRPLPMWVRVRGKWRGWAHQVMETA